MAEEHVHLPDESAEAIDADEEKLAHEAFVASLGEDALWRAVLGAFAS